MSERLNNDVDPIETRDWLQAIESVIREEGVERAQFLIDQVLGEARKGGVNVAAGAAAHNYVNTIAVEDEPAYPGNLDLERRIRSAIRWNAIMTVLRASKKDLELGGHMASFQSSATFYEVCFNHFFRARNEKDGGDLVYFQGHISPGVYARAFLEGRLTEEQMNNFRQEVHGNGLSSYPHPKLMPEFWQFPTVSMGLGPISAIYQAKFLKYLEHRGLKDTSEQTVYAFLGDGEMDEPESKGAITIATREKLDNLVFVINCNLQRLDGPVTGNGKIINELEGIFSGAGWQVLKVIWGGRWDELLRKDTSGKLVQLMNETLDGDYQTFKSKDGAYVREHFFGRYPETAALVKDMTDDEIWALNRGGHDPKKIFAALKKAQDTKGKPTVILAHTIKGYGMGETGWCRCTDPVGGRPPVFLLHDRRHHCQGDLRRRFAAQRQADRRMNAFQLLRREFGNLLQPLAPPRAVSQRAHGADVKRRGVDRFHQRQVVHARIVGQRHDGGIGVATAVLNELGRKLAQQRHARFQLGGEVIQRLRAALAHQHLKPQCHGEVGAVQRHAGQPGDQQARRGRDVQGDLLEPAFDLGGAGEVALLKAVAGVGQRQAFDQRVMPFQRAGDALQISDAGFSRRQILDQHVQHAAAGQRHVGRHAAFAITDHLAGRLILPGGYAP